ncbi:Hypothetical protein; putative signal peptide [Leptospira biflexa serovar Patoc strain 'Patoc 1 (Paris)']|uniref:Uncharacterized protein n=2 Tax=Leptospira biflexa TaxID=172 RepID=B0SLP2_LEPBP|nr:Hypothetical protein; putative signal peptide [Leptospira biflexa serovar Patoc strain 'Patoc 1 (Paris)']
MLNVEFRMSLTRSKQLFLICRFLWLFVLFSTSGSAKERKVIRFSGELISWESVGENSHFRFLDATNLRERTILCDPETMSLSFGNKTKGNLYVEGKAAQSSPTSDQWLCVGKPHVFQKYQVTSQARQAQTKTIQGQVVEADPSTGQIVYLVRGRRFYITIDPMDAKEMAEALSQMKTVTIDGEYRYDRIKRYYVKD